MDIDKLQAGEELDALVAEKVLNREFCAHRTRCKGPRIPCWDTDGAICLTCGKPLDIPKYSTEISKAWEVLLKAFPQGNAGPVRNDVPRGKDSCIGDEWLIISLNYHDFSVIADGPTAPLAICRAALKAVGI